MSRRHPAAACKKWLIRDNNCLMTCQYQSQPGLRGYRLRFHAFWKEERLFQVEQRLCDQVGIIQKKGWLSQQKRRQVESDEINVESSQEKQNRTETYVTSDRTTFAQDEEDEGRGEENAELLRQY